MIINKTFDSKNKELFVVFLNIYGDVDKLINNCKPQK